MLITIQFPPEEILALIGICTREANLCHHSGSEASATKALDLVMALKKSMRDAGLAQMLPKNPMNDCAL